MRAAGLIRLVVVGAACRFACGALAAPIVAGAPVSRAQSRPPVQARVMTRVNEDATTVTDVTLVGRDGDVLLAQSAQTGTVVVRLEKARVLRCEFDIDYDRSAVAQAIQRNDWAAAVRILSPAVRLTLPFLDIPENNGLEQAMDLGVYMLSSADREVKLAADEAGRERARQQYAAAYEVFQAAGKAAWSPEGQVATLKGCLAQIAQNKCAEAEETIGSLDEPSPDEVPYGHYWLVKGELLHHAGKTREALDAVVKSVVFANKDVETFPSALLLSATCYAELGEFYRARDLYYEVAVLFVGTAWAEDALAGLTPIMASKKTAEPEKAPIENVFFNVSDDINKLANELIEARSPKKNAAGAAPEKKAL